MSSEGMMASSSAVAARSPAHSAGGSPDRPVEESRGRSNRRSKSRERSRSPVPPSKVLGVFGLSDRTTEDDLRDHFNKFADTDRVFLIVDKGTGLSRCFGFIYYHTVEDAMKAKEGSKGLVLAGREIRTDFSLTKRSHSPTPGQYMGRKKRGGDGPGAWGRSSSRRGYGGGYGGSGGMDRYMPRGGYPSSSRYSSSSYYDDRGGDPYYSRGGSRDYDDRRYERDDRRDSRYDDRGSSRYSDRRYDDRGSSRYDRYDPGPTRYDDRY